MLVFGNVQDSAARDIEWQYWDVSSTFKQMSEFDEQFVTIRSRMSAM